MSDYFDRYEHELRAAVVRRHAPASSPAVVRRRWRRRPPLGNVVAALAAVVAVAIGGGAIALLSHARVAGNRTGESPTAASAVPAGASWLLDRYAVLRRPQAAADRVPLADVNSALHRLAGPNGAGSIVSGLTRVLTRDGVRVELFVVHSRAQRPASVSANRLAVPVPVAGYSLWMNVAPGRPELHLVAGSGWLPAAPPIGLVPGKIRGRSFKQARALALRAAQMRAALRPAQMRAALRPAQMRAALRAARLRALGQAAAAPVPTGAPGPAVPPVFTLPRVPALHRVPALPPVLTLPRLPNVAPVPAAVGILIAGAPVVTTSGFVVEVVPDSVRSVSVVTVPARSRFNLPRLAARGRRSAIPASDNLVLIPAGRRPRHLLLVTWYGGGVRGVQRILAAVP